MKIRNVQKMDYIHGNNCSDKDYMKTAKKDGKISREK